MTLHVGLDTFRPLQEAVVEEHRIHGERYSVEPPAWERIRSAERVLAVGTTTTRVLETVAARRAAAPAAPSSSSRPASRSAASITC